jgi:hypothetical protein
LQAAEDLAIDEALATLPECVCQPERGSRQQP